MLVTDQIYYKIQYPLKKAISSLKKLDEEGVSPEELNQEEKKKIEEFIASWEDGGEKSLRELVGRLRQKT